MYTALMMLANWSTHSWAADMSLMGLRFSQLLKIRKDINHQVLVKPWQNWFTQEVE